jgi:hypothetical protein
MEQLLLDEVVEVPVVNVLTREADRFPRVINNPAVRHFFPDVSYVIMDWSDVVKRANQVKTKKGDARANKDRVRAINLESALAEPLIWDDRKYFGNLAWGSMVKQLKTIGLETDVFIDLMKFAEDAQRIGRLLFSDSRFGAAILKKLEVKFVRDGEFYKGYRAGDGCGFIKKSVAMGIYNGYTPWIHLDRGRNNLQVSQRFDWKKIKSEAKPLILENVKRMDAEFNLEMAIKPGSWKYEQIQAQGKAHFIEWDEAMKYHPYLVNALSRATAKAMIEVATTVPLDGFVRVVVPSWKPYPIMPVGKYLTVRWPVDAWGNIIPMEITEEAGKEYEQKLAEVSVIQHSFLGKSDGKWVGGKGNLIVLDDEIMGKDDIVFCSEDIKVGTDRLEKLRKQRYIKFSELYLGITQWWAPGCAVAIPDHVDIPVPPGTRGLVDGATAAEGGKYIKLQDGSWIRRVYVWKGAGGDYDGDLTTIYDASRTPKMYEQAQGFPIQESFKIKKEPSGLHKRTKMVAESMTNFVGYATNVVATTFAKGVAGRAELAHVMGFKSVEELDVYCNKVIKIATDGFKTMSIQLSYWRDTLNIHRGLLTRHLGRMAPWTKWVRSEWAFRHGVPEFLDELDQEYLDQFKSKEQREEDEWLSHIPTSMRESIVAKIYEIVQPYMRKWFSAVDEEGRTIFEQTQCALLSDYADWAPPVSERAMALAWELQDKYNAMSSGFFQQVSEENRDYDDIQFVEFDDVWVDIVNDFLKKHGKTFVNRRDAAYAMWRVAHHSRGRLSGAGSVFKGFPDQIEHIIKDKPGLREISKGTKSLVLGLNYSFKKNVPETMRGIPIEVKAAEIGLTLRTVVMALIPMDGLIMEDHGDYPGGMIGLVAKIEKSHEQEGLTSLPKGKFLADFVRKSGGTYYVWVRPLEEPQA